MPDHDDPDERIARLQRAAFGANVPDAEREAAARELAVLRSAGPSRPVAAPEPTAGGEPRAASPADRADDRGHPTSAPSRTTLIAATAVALLVGLGAGLTLDAVIPQPDEPGSVPTSETAAWRVFDAPVPNGDRVRYPAPQVEVELDRDSRRLLAARSDGVRVVAVRSEDGRDACLVLVVPSGPSAASCTSDGRFPPDGLVVRTEQPDTGTFSATWDANGRVSLGPEETERSAG